jgi:hypothetical protein
MQTRTRINLFLLIITGLLGLLAWLSQPPSLPSLTELDPQQITRIRIDDLQGREISLQRLENQWMSDDKPADPSRIGQLLKICQTPSLRRFPAPDDLAPFGLTPAPIVMNLDDAILSFGNNDPLNGWRYVLYEDEIHLIADGFHHHLLAPAQAWLAQP